MNIVGLIHPWLLMGFVSLALAPALARAGAAEGKAAFTEQKCIKCHSLSGKTGKLENATHGGALDHTASKSGHDRAWFQRYIKNPAAIARWATKRKGCWVTVLLR